MKFKVGDRVYASSFMAEGVGTIIFIGKDIYADEFKPVQVKLDEPYDNTGHDMFRFTLKQIKHT